jgi:pilus assembly protein Flp/PilA
MSMIKSFAKDESGATAIEYGLIAALIAVVCIATWRSIGAQMLIKFKDVEAGLK